MTDAPKPFLVAFDFMATLRAAQLAAAIHHGRRAAITIDEARALSHGLMALLHLSGAMLDAGDDAMRLVHTLTRAVPLDLPPAAQTIFIELAELAAADRCEAAA